MGALRRMVQTLVAAALAGATLAGTSVPAAEAAAPPSHGSHAVPAGCNRGSTAADGTTPLARCFAVGLADGDGDLVEQEDEPLPGSLGPAEIQDAYALPDGGDGRTVAIVDAFGYEDAEADLAVFRAHYGLPPCTTANGCFRKVDQRGGTDYPVQNADWSIETALDVDAVSAACPNCHILLVQADNNGSFSLGESVNTAADLGAVAISNSYGVAGEFPFESYYDHYYDHPGIAVTVSSGDIGNLQGYPATSPDVISVGGTTLTPDDSSPRGWRETAWSDGGSGCSLYEPRPAYQDDIETGCAQTRATADVAADADSETGLAVYNTLGQDGWAQWGGTSLSSPLVAAMFALAGEPVPDSHPVTYLYRHGLSLHDITDGSDGYCGDVRCNAGPGWDGPTGVGTPDGVSALTLGDYGYVSGTVSSAKKPVPGATVTFTDATGYASDVVTDEKGRYRLALAVGSYRVVAGKLGYADATSNGLTIAAGGTTTTSSTLQRLATRTVTGTVRDGSGQGWPMYARITVDDGPDAPLYTDPYTGRFSIDLPVGSTYTLHTEPVDMPGYAAAETRVDVPAGSSAVTQDVALSADGSVCSAAGYAYTYAGAGTRFEGWSSARDGWRVTDDAHTGKTWVFDDPGTKGNLTGGDGGFAIVDNWAGTTATNDTSLLSPVGDLSGQSAPVVGFDTYYYDYGWGLQDGDVDLSLDGGTTWENVWHAPDAFVQGHVEVPIPQAAGRSDVVVRFRFSGEYDNFWELDNVVVGARSCDPAPGGLVEGVVSDANTGEPVTGAVVTADGARPAVSQATPDDPATGDGYYWLFHPGGTAVTAAGRHYETQSASVAVAAHRVVRQDWQLRAGRVSATAAGLEVSAGRHGADPGSVTLTNNGAVPAHVKVVEQDRGFTPVGGHHAAASPGAPLKKTPLHDATAFRPNERHAGTTAPSAREAEVNPAWSDLPNFPTPIMDNVVAESDGVVYSVGGFTDAGITAAGYAYDADAGSWQRIADLPAPRENAVGGFVDGRLYVAGGWDGKGNLTSTTFAYDPAADRWTRVADIPAPSAAASGAVADGGLYIVSGCTTVMCTEATPTYRYDPDDDAWTRLADYPEHVVMAGCATPGEGLVCAGGLVPAEFAGDEHPVSSAYRYVPGSDAWTAVAALPYPVWGASSAGADGRLQMVGGITGDIITNQAVEFDPATGAWSALPNATYPMFRGGAACGLTRVGGSIGDGFAAPYVERLPGQGACVSGDDVGWLATDKTEVVVPPGGSVQVRVAFDAAATSERGTYAARLAFVTDTPYTVPPVDVSLRTR